jgi:hypothetical protein
VLSDPQRRSDYDRLSSNKSSSEQTSDPNASSNFFRMFSGMFANSAAGNGPSSAASAAEQPDQRPNADQVFGDVFEDVRHLLSLSPLFIQRTRTNGSPTPPFFSLFFSLSLLYSFYDQRLSGISRGGAG